MAEPPHTPDRDPDPDGDPAQQPGAPLTPGDPLAGAGAGAEAPRSEPASPRSEPEAPPRTEPFGAGPEAPRFEPFGAGPEAPRYESFGAGPEGLGSLYPARPRLTRSSTDRVIAGVAGGLARHLGIDALLVRIAFVVLAFAGGAGVIAYLAALLFMPSDRPGATNVTGRAATITGGALLALAAAVLVGGPFLALAGPGLLVAALAVAGVLLLGRSARGGDALHVGARVLLALLLLGVAVAGAIAVGIAAALGGGEVIAGLVIVTGLAMVVAAFTGGLRWMIVPALMLLIPLGLVAALDLDVRGGVGDREYVPTTRAELADGFELGAGQLRVDLRDVELPRGRTDLDLRVGLGVVQVIVPDDVCVGYESQIGAGFSDVRNRESAGLDLDISHRPTPRTAATPLLVLHTDVGVGGIEVRNDVFFESDDRGPPWDERRRLRLGDSFDTPLADRACAGRA
jgi:phage shock protein PspC (stress-responsive transcriptional regulator)